MAAIDGFNLKFVYCRLHGSEELYASGYDEEALDRWAARVAGWACEKESPDGNWVIKKEAPIKAPRDVFVYFDNDAKVRAPVDARHLICRADKLLARQRS